MSGAGHVPGKFVEAVTIAELSRSTMLRNMVLVVETFYLLLKSWHWREQDLNMVLVESFVCSVLVLLRFGTCGNKV